MIPPDVIDSFSMLYPSVKDVNWNLLEKDFEVNFVLKERAVWILFDHRGNLMMVKNKIDHTELPVPVITKLKMEYADWSIRKAISIDILGTTSYQLELESAREKVHLTYSSQGDITELLSVESLK